MRRVTRSSGLPGGQRVPTLEVLPIRDIRFHEEVDLARVAALIERLGADRVLRNPPIVARDRGPTRLLLDGANRIEALRRMGIRHALVQTESLDDPALALRRWHHVIRRREADRLEQSPPAEVRVASPAAREPEVLCRLIRPDGREIAFAGPRTSPERAAALRRIGAMAAHSRARVGRIVRVDLDEVRRTHPEFGGLLVYGEVTLEQVCEAAAAGELLPSGVTRFLVPRRVLGFDLPLPFLEMSIPLRQKRRRLQALVAERFESDRVRYYAEPVIVFDD